MFRIFRYIFYIATIAIAAVIIYRAVIADKPAQAITVSNGHITDISTMAQLCTVDIYTEVPVLDTIHGKVLFGIQKQRGTISFDLENLDIDTSADTIFVTLPTEIITLRESADKDSWRVIDEKNLNPLGRDRITDAEENIIKSRIIRRTRRRLYNNGTVARARKEAAVNLAHFLRAIYRKPVLVTTAPSTK